MPSMQNGPNPHSLEFKKNKFNKIINYFVQNEPLKSFTIDNPPSAFPDDILKEMKDIGFETFRKIGGYKVFSCGSGVVGKVWGFVYGDFTNDQVQQPSLIEGNGDKLYLSYLKKLGGKWYRFSAGKTLE